MVPRHSCQPLRRGSLSAWRCYTLPECLTVWQIMGARLYRRVQPKSLESAVGCASVSGQGEKSSQAPFGAHAEISYPSQAMALHIFLSCCILDSLGSHSYYVDDEHCTEAYDGLVVTARMSICWTHNRHSFFAPAVVVIWEALGGWYYHPSRCLWNIVQTSKQWTIKAARRCGQFRT
eukprot:2284984-Amphidinium_carterae.1